MYPKTIKNKNHIKGKIKNKEIKKKQLSYSRCTRGSCEFIAYQMVLEIEHLRF